MQVGARGRSDRRHDGETTQRGHRAISRRLRGWLLDIWLQLLVDEPARQLRTDQRRTSADRVRPLDVTYHTGEYRAVTCVN